MATEGKKLNVIEIKRHQSEIYESIMNKGDDWMELVKKYEEVIRKEIEINIGSTCQCGKEFEHHFIEKPHQAKPMIDKISEMIRRGECTCGREGPGHHKVQSVKLTFAHIAASANNVDILRLLESNAELFKQQTSELKLSPIFIAVSLKNQEVIDFLFTQDIDVNAVCTNQQVTILWCAVRQKNAKLVERILQFPGVNVNIKSIHGESPAFKALTWGYKEIFDMLIDAGADVNSVTTVGENNLLMKAVTQGIDYVTKLIEKGVDVNQTNDRQESALHYAVYIDSIEIVEALVEANIDLNVQGTIEQMTPIVFAACQDQTDMVEVLARSGADVNIPSNQGYNAVHFAAWNGELDMLKVLLECEGVEHDRLTSDKNSPLGLACHGGHAEAVEMLLPKGCNVNNQDKDNDTALLYAAYNGMTDSVRLLLEYGADPDLRNNFNVSPLWNAVYGKHTEIVKVLLGTNVMMEVNSVGTDHHSGSNEVVRLFTSPRSTMYVAVQRGCIDIVYLLLSAGYNIYKEQWLLSGDHSELEQQANILTMLTKQASQPPRLISICRNYFRRYGNPLKIKELVQELDLPKYLKNYLLLTELLTKS